MQAAGPFSISPNPTHREPVANSLPNVQPDFGKIAAMPGPRPCRRVIPPPNSQIRNWPEVALLALLCCAAVCARGQAAAPAKAAPAVDAITGIVHSRRLASGVPLGGIGAGTFQVMTDGLISQATYNNNWAYPTGDIPGCFAAVHVQTGTRSVNRVLALASPYGLPTVAGLNYEGLFPVAKLTCLDPALPISVSSRVFSPLIPHDVRNSTFPAAAFIFRLTNTSTADVDVSLALSWENTLGVGGTVATGPFDNRTGNTVTVAPDADGFFAERFERPAAPKWMWLPGSETTPRAI